MESMSSELLAHEKMEAISREERPPDLPPIVLDGTETAEGSEDLMGVEDLPGVGARVMGKLDLGPRGLAVGFLVLLGLGMFIEVLRLWSARPRQKTQALAGAGRAGAPRR